MKSLGKKQAPGLNLYGLQVLAKSGWYRMSWERLEEARQEELYGVLCISSIYIVT